MATGRIVYCPLVNLSVTNDLDQDIWELASPAGNKIKLHGFALYSASLVAEAVVLQLMRGTASGSGGGAATEVLANKDNSTLTGVIETLNTTPGTPSDVLMTYTWEQLGPLREIFTPEMQPVMQESDWLKLTLSTALGATTVWNGWVCWEEI